MRPLVEMGAVDAAGFEASFGATLGTLVTAGAMVGSTLGAAVTTGAALAALLAFGSAPASAYGSIVALGAGLTLAVALPCTLAAPEAIIDGAATVALALVAPGPLPATLGAMASTDRPLGLADAVGESLAKGAAAIEPASGPKPLGSVDECNAARASTPATVSAAATPASGAHLRLESRDLARDAEALVLDAGGSIDAAPPSADFERLAVEDEADVLILDEELLAAESSNTSDRSLRSVGRLRGSSRSSTCTRSSVSRGAAAGCGIIGSTYAAAA